MPSTKKQSPTPEALRGARAWAELTQTEAAELVQASLRAWQQWEAGDRTMPPGLYELFMIKTGQWTFGDENDVKSRKECDDGS